MRIQRSATTKACGSARAGWGAAFPRSSG